MSINKTNNSEGTSNHIKGCDLLILSLEKEGVDTIFAYPGGTSLEIHDAIARRGTLRVVLPRHEQGGIFEADGYARASGKVGVCMATSGPGATNFVTGIANAYADSIPLVVLTGQVQQEAIGKNAFQETDFFGITLPISKYSYLITNVNDIPRIVKEAFYLASTGRPGPVVIDIPKNIQQKLTTIPTEWPSLPSLRGYNPNHKATDQQLAEIVELIKNANAPLIYAGGGITSSNSSEELRKFVKKTQIPITTTLLGIGSYPEDDFLSLKYLGMHGAAYANWAAKEADLILAMGCRFDDRVTGNTKAFASKAKIVHIDIDPAEINKNKKVDCPIEGDIHDALKRLNLMLDKAPLQKDFSQWHQRINEWKNKVPFNFCINQKMCSTHLRNLHNTALEEIIMPQYVIQLLSEMTKGEAIIATGVGQHQMWACQFYQFKHPRSLLTSGGLGSMGYGYPAAIGAKVAFPDKEVINIDGDGSFQMNIQEMATARTENIAVKVIILNNQHLGMPVQWQDSFYGGLRADTFMGDPSGKFAVYPDFVKIAAGYAIQGEQVIFKKDLRQAIQRMLDSKDSYILDVIIPVEAKVMPFIKPAGTVDDMVYEIPNKN